MADVMVITGGSGGIGSATALLAAEHGYAVVLGYAVRAEEAEATALEVRRRGGTALVVQGDVRREADVTRLFETTDRELGTLSVLVNSAGLAAGQSPLAEMSAERIERVIATNVLGTLLCSREAVRRMSTQRGGKGGAIVNLSSAAARLGSPNEYVDYAASKGAIDSFTVGLAREVGPEGIRVAAVRAGIIATDFHARAGEPGRAARLASTIPLRRAGTAEEVAGAIVWLASPAAAYATGALLDVSGGR
jgi:NAD(P)-dependent dehydrogenase (short-subunit alcohol dehydrogenase family)